MNAGMPTPKPQMYGLVRDKNGKPRIDGDPRELPQPIKDMMSVLEYMQAIRDFEEGA